MFKIVKDEVTKIRRTVLLKEEKEEEEEAEKEEERGRGRRKETTWRLVGD